MGYKQLTLEQRYHISAEVKVGTSKKDIAEELHVHKSTIYREMKRNKGTRGYRPKQAQEKAEHRRTVAHKHIKLNDELTALIIDKLNLDWSPDQISGYLKKENLARVSHERIYQFILADKKAGGELYKHLRHSGKKRKKRYGSKDRRGQIKNRVSIDERPTIVAEKERIGDWEGDTIIGKQHEKAIVTLVDRVSKKVLIGNVATKHSVIVSNIMVKLLMPFKEISHTITLDNGKEFSDHEKTATALDTKIYFAHPYHSWERGLNENTNGLIRQYIPKGSSFHDISDEHIQWITERLNNRPRKTLGYRTPNEVFEEAYIQNG